MGSIKNKLDSVINSLQSELEIEKEALVFHNLQQTPRLDKFIGRKDELIYYQEKINIDNFVVIEGAAGNGKTLLASKFVANQKQKKVFWLTFRYGINDDIESIIFELAYFLFNEGNSTLWKFIQTEKSKNEKFPLTMKIGLLLHSIENSNIVLCFDDFHIVNYNAQITAFFKELKRKIYKIKKTKTFQLLIVTRHRPIFVNSYDYKILSGFSLSETTDFLLSQSINLNSTLLNDIFIKTRGNPKLLDLFIAWHKSKRPTHEVIVEFIKNMVLMPNIKYFLLQEVYITLSESEKKTIQFLSVFRLPVSYTVLIKLFSNEIPNIFIAINKLVDKHIIEESEDGKTLFFHSILSEFFYMILNEHSKKKVHKKVALHYINERNYHESLFHFWSAQMYNEVLSILDTNFNFLVDKGYSNSTLEFLYKIVFELENNNIFYQIYFFIGKFQLIIGEYKKAIESFIISVKGNFIPEKTADIQRKIAKCYQKTANYKEALNYLRLSKYYINKRPQNPQNHLIDIDEGFLLCHIGKIQEGLEKCKNALDKLKDINYSKQKARGFSDLAWIHIISGNFTEAIKLLHTAKKNQIALNDFHGLGITLSRLGRVLWQKGQWQESNENHSSSLKIALIVGDIQLEALCYRHIGLIEWNKGMLDLSMISHTKSLRIYKRIADQWGIAACYENIAVLEYENRNFEIANNYLDNAIYICEKIGSKDFLSYALLYKAKISIQNRDYISGILYCNKSLKLLNEWNYSSFYIGMAYRALAEAYMTIDISESIKYIKKSFDIYTELQSQYQLGKSLYWYSIIKLATNEIDVAKEKLDKALTIFQKMNLKLDIQKIKKLEKAIELKK